VSDIVYFGLLFAAWLFLFAYLLPKLGVPT
jgi:hypothetical protein